MKITRVSLRDFRGFPGPDACSFDLGQGKNLLLYGENGSGKSSLFEALKGVFNHRSPAIFGDGHANVFTPSDEGFVSINLSDANPDEYRWDQGEVPSGESAQAQYLDIARRAVFLDYRDLLKTHFLHREAEHINLFDLLVESLLADLDFGDGRALSVHWNELQAVRGESLREEGEMDAPYDPFGAMVSAADTFRSQLDAILHTPTEHQPCLVEAANAFLAQLDPNLRMELRVGDSLCPPKESLSWANRFSRREVLLEVNYAGHRPRHPGLFLNEARLTAIALSLFLAGAKLNRPATASGDTLRLLVLDDVLIGLDLAHRLPLLKLLEREFAGWQIFVFTHDLTWFEMVRQQVDEQQWAICELFCERRPGELFERPVLRQGGVEGFLQRAKSHLDSGEKRAAAVYARAAFEEKIRKFCSDKSISLPFKANPSQIDGETFLGAAEKRIKSQGHWNLYGDLFHRLRMVRKVILNPLSHSNLVNLLTPEIADAIEAVEALHLVLPDAHPSREECIVLLGSALQAALPIAAARSGVNIPEAQDNEIRAAIELVEAMKFDEKKAKPALERARSLAAQGDTPENKLMMASLLRAAFEDSVAAFVKRKKCLLPYSTKWEEVETSELWKAAKEHQKLKAPAAQPFVTAIDSEENKVILFDALDPCALSDLDWPVFTALLNTLEAVAPDVTYAFQTKLDILAK
jgi:energy-coupling factor transporter ATP-binding protein EcfA2